MNNMLSHRGSQRSNGVQTYQCGKRPCGFPKKDGRSLRAACGVSSPRNREQLQKRSSTYHPTLGCTSFHPSTSPGSAPLFSVSLPRCSDLARKLDARFAAALLRRADAEQRSFRGSVLVRRINAGDASEFLGDTIWGTPFM